MADLIQNFDNSKVQEYLTKDQIRELAPVASRIVLKALYLARNNRPHCLWAVNTLARNVTKWSAACDKRLFRLMSYLNVTKSWGQTNWVGDPIETCKLYLFVDASFAGDLTDSKSTKGAILVIVGPNTWVPITWICKKQGAVSHSSSEAEIISLEAATRMEGCSMSIAVDRGRIRHASKTGKTDHSKTKIENNV